MSTDGESRPIEIIDYDGAPATVSYGDPTAEYAALDEGAALLDLSRRRLIRATGEERADFLHGQLSGDIRGLAEGGGCAALLLNGQGRVVSILYVYRRREALLLSVDAAWLARAREGLEHHLVADDCEFENLAPTPSIGVAGPRAVSVLRDADFGGRLDAEGYVVSEGKIAGVSVTVLGRGCLRVPCFDVCTAAGTKAAEFEAVGDALAHAGAVRAGVSAYECVRMESGIARYGVDIDDRRLALEARLYWAIHFAKGCYLGQEVIERSVSRGKLKRRLSLLVLEGIVAAGDRIAGGSESELVSSVADSPRLGLIALAYVAEASSAQGSRLEIDTCSGAVAATVLAWPRDETLVGR